MAKKYRPSNGTEGDWFWSLTCAKCIKRSDCSIYWGAMAGGSPRQWILNEADVPTCTSLQETRKETSYHCPKTADMFDQPA